jgi:zinc protease
MNRRFPLIALCSVLCLLACAPALSQVDDWKQIQPPALHGFHPQMPKRIQLANGMVIFLQEDHELPLIRGTAQIRGGSRDEPDDKIGLVEIYGQAWRTGGTKQRTGDQLDDYLEARAAKVETHSAVDSTRVTWDCLKENLDDVFKVFLEVLREPEFREDKIVLAKNRLNTNISRRNDDPFSIAFRERPKLVYGADSPYARQDEYATVARVSKLHQYLEWYPIGADVARSRPNSVGLCLDRLDNGVHHGRDAVLPLNLFVPFEVGVNTLLRRKRRAFIR